MNPLPSALICSLLVGACAWACQCAPPPPGAVAPNPAVCNSLPDLSREDQAIFVGTVTDVYPKSPEHMLKLWEGFLGKPVVEDGPAPTLAEMKRIVVGMWRQTLSAFEIRQVLSAHSEEDLEAIVDHALGWEMAKRVRLRVSEAFTSGLGEDFELFTGMGGGDCGIQFEEGQSYLV
jgi:hypothetical protein